MAIPKCVMCGKRGVDDTMMCKQHLIEMYPPAKSRYPVTGEFPTITTPKPDFDPLLKRIATVTAIVTTGLLIFGIVVVIAL